MSGFNLQKTDLYHYSHVILNSHRMKTVTPYNRILQSKLDSFEDLLMSAFSNLNCYVHSYKDSISNPEKHNYELGLIDDVDTEYKINWNNGAPLFNTMVNQLEGKKINEDMFEFLVSIIDHQKDISKHILDRKLTIDRVEIVFNHLKEVPYNLKSDLEIESLSSYKPVINSSEEKWEIIASNYDSNQEKYRIGA